MRKFELFLRDLAKQRKYTLYSAKDLPIISYEHHRFIIPVVWLAYKYNLMDIPFNIVYFDRHPDALEPPAVKKKTDKYVMYKNFEDVIKFVNDKMCVYNDDWVKFLMNAGMVKDALLIGGDTHLGEIFDNDYVDRYSRVHKIKRVESLRALQKAQNDPQIKDILNGPQLLLDIDLDYFTHKINNMIKPWQPKDFTVEFKTNLMTKLIHKAKFITIARETLFCGGEQAQEKIWKNLQKVLRSSLAIKSIEKFPIV